MLLVPPLSILPGGSCSCAIQKAGPCKQHIMTDWVIEVWTPSAMCKLRAICPTADRKLPLRPAMHVNQTILGRVHHSGGMAWEPTIRVTFQGTTRCHGDPMDEAPPASDACGKEVQPPRPEGSADTNMTLSSEGHGISQPPSYPIHPSGLSDWHRTHPPD
ncbi:hypothetical protein BDQ94DRAFT_184176 [Aspergillus welwitschiae]|uniref:Uncharacterized protein n=1 Tax=Aspergillus welwitschiae TaxID=1341132 RepID=A0A3F3PNJ5_9EURO|nr:hypothetical protein BDQ94DRAFT_184176 [Aspergillus welwitschiae]RDH27906.1 hypothetical protein BDQ94DRAFT_184176 [Aspergillus welwitschiae]